MKKYFNALFLSLQDFDLCKICYLHVKYKPRIDQIDLKIKMELADEGNALNPTNESENERLNKNVQR